MQISFKGFQNTGIGIDSNQYVKQILPNNPNYKTPPYIHVTLAAKIDDVGLEDRKFFSEILNKFPNNYEKDTVNLFYDKYYTDVTKKYNKEFWLNGKPLVLREDNLAVFSKIAQLFTRLSKVSDKELKMDREYLNSNECKSNFSYFSLKDKYQIIKNSHRPEVVRKNAKIMIKEIEEIMFDYFNR